jgi:hypothetical protein
MPQLDVFTFTTQAFWTLMGFSLLYVIVAKLVLPRLGFLMNVRKRLHFRMLLETYSNIENAAKVNKIVKTLSKNQCKKMLTYSLGVSDFYNTSKNLRILQHYVGKEVNPVIWYVTKEVWNLEIATILL